MLLLFVGPDYGTYDEYDREQVSEWVGWLNLLPIKSNEAFHTEDQLRSCYTGPLHLVCY